MWHFQRDVIRLHWKGAAEIVLALCTSWIDVDGSSHEMTPDKVYWPLFRFAPSIRK
jgi:hypothetical protein